MLLNVACWWDPSNWPRTKNAHWNICFLKQENTRQQNYSLKIYLEKMIDREKVPSEKYPTFKCNICEKVNYWWNFPVTCNPLKQNYINFLLNFIVIIVTVSGINKLAFINYFLNIFLGVFETVWSPSYACPHGRRWKSLQMQALRLGVQSANSVD